MITFKNKGDFSKLDEYLKKSVDVTEIKNITPIMDECIRQLQEVTPKDSSLTSKSWTYEIQQSKNKKIIAVNNTNVIDGINIAFIIDIGHSTGSGGWVSGKNYIEPIVRESYNKILNNTWKELKRL